MAVKYSLLQQSRLVRGLACVFLIGIQQAAAAEPPALPAFLREQLKLMTLSPDFDWARFNFL
ncbi:MAG: hypothetical protein AABY83_08255, partial [Pseudomonadota bacterium]